MSNPVGGVILGSRFESRVVLISGHKHQHNPLPKGKFDNAAGSKDGGEEDEEFNLKESWVGQFKEAVLPSYDPDDGNLWVTMAVHYISFTFKVICACLPPAEWMSGYPCLTVTLLVLAATMVVVKEVAEQFGCACGLSDLMTGMSIVAMGTSLPDTFAAQYAAIQDDSAVSHRESIKADASGRFRLLPSSYVPVVVSFCHQDAAIGCVMGSNAVNVIIGLGLPWIIYTGYSATVQKTAYKVESGVLGFAVIIFFILAFIAVVMIMVRRKIGGELGARTVGVQVR